MKIRSFLSTACAVLLILILVSLRAPNVRAADRAPEPGLQIAKTAHSSSDVVISDSELARDAAQSMP